MAANSSSTGSKSSGGAGGKQSGPSAEQLVATFQRMRQEQRSMASKAAELEMDINEHRLVAPRQLVTSSPAGGAGVPPPCVLCVSIFLSSLVIDTLKDVDPSRKCFRLVGGVLVERTVKEVLPALESNKEQISKIIESLNTQMQAKGRELTEYRERYNIRLVGEGEGEGQGQSAASSGDSEGGGAKSAAGVLVS
ncbi:prefoldin subunit 2 isoform 1-T1 [Aulostomus maculatus]